ncbi:hypothetical protein EW145_g6513 [Phellinidium pouzarii]|uniref:MYND-type domain-containing protein n=1 Tax=Phellinidium pouzarii TaxID=167371 RepID=A0A4S4KY72_9AGAM|nr:hypothetical protein EW145_g6513 [Phellinidium pouzarii]
MPAASAVKTVPKGERKIEVKVAIHTCISCCKAPSAIKRCSRCKKVSYCNVACQSADYAKHEEFCKAVASLRPNWPRFDVNNDKPVEDQCAKIIEGLTQLLARPLNERERRLFIFEPRCIECSLSNEELYQAASKGIGANRLDFCEDCLSTFYCSTEHRNACETAHKNDPFEEGARISSCEMSKRIAVDDKVLGMACLDVAKIKPRPINQVYKPLRRFGDPKRSAWTTWFNESISDRPALFSSTATTKRLLTQSQTTPLTILYGIELFDKIPSPRPLLVHNLGLEVHILEMTEGVPDATDTIFEDILHWNPQYKYLTVHFFGAKSLTKRDSNIRVAVCSHCRSKGKHHVHALHAQLYHEWVAQQDKWTGSWTPPDLALMFNATMNPSDTQEWEPTLRLLAESCVPTLITSYHASEAAVNELITRSVGAKIVIPSHRNPWRDEMANLEPCGGKGFFFNNGIVFGFQGLV